MTFLTTYQWVWSIQLSPGEHLGVGTIMSQLHLSKSLWGQTWPEPNLNENTTYFKIQQHNLQKVLLIKCIALQTITLTKGIALTRDYFQQI